MWFLRFLFKKRITLSEAFEKGDDEGIVEFFAKTAKLFCWYVIIGMVAFSISQPIESNEVGFYYDWPIDFLYAVINLIFDFLRTIAQYRLSIDWG